MGFIQAISAGFTKYFNFSDRACRSEFWYWMLFAGTVAIVGNIGNWMLHTNLVNLLLGLPFFFPSWAVEVRRLHDIDRSGWWILIAVIPFIGAIILIRWFATKGDEGRNRFGSDPLAANPFPNHQFGAAT
ncbi:MAG: DUF805 domain-containing protein [Mycobacterium sp.]|uniref:DUF805 domain-containing protein n=1 Tax=Mycobacterium sp. TaxID=1785 RepID=UPI003C521932